ncbi:MAG TPA: phosphoribosylformylglycinamidine synthase subunit PurL [Candidatus Atribacteria bacterium]|nr:phosphoribosylformylglycinamidine synthase subunit PurL [Candidatus Atribacteria bacterium]
MKSFNQEKFWEKWNLTPKEYDKIKEYLQREPNEVELGMYSVMWSEHCSYKNSKPLLKLFPNSAEWVLQGPGENAGIIDIGDDQVIAMKIESHNHPSAIEPFQGAATGIGGIVRDIFAMGARPIALLDSLRFGDFGNPQTQYLYKGVIEGISFYGNCIGVPTVGGETVFSSSYQENILVNVMCVGYAKKNDILRAVARGEGNLVILIGAKTGRDGIGGASFASTELDENSDEDRPAVQIGDPFSEKLLIEACLEIRGLDYVIGLQDCGAAGLTSSLCEMASRGDSGLDVELSKVPQREEGMNPFEIMLSESQERMILVVKKGKEEEIKKIFNKWGLDSAVIGRVTNDGKFRVRNKGKIVADIPAKSLAEGAPICPRKGKKPEFLSWVNQLDLSEISQPDDYNQVLLRLLGSPNIMSKEKIYEHYDYMVRNNTILSPGDDAVVLRIKGTKKAIALTTDGNGRYCYLDPLIGGKIAVAEAARNLSCKGALPRAVTDCLNFGNPERETIYWQLEEAIKGISEACRVLETPVISGNVSLYNESKGEAIYPTPVIGMVGIIEDYKHICSMEFKNSGDLIVLLGENKGELGGSEYLKVIHNLEKGIPPQIDLLKERAVQNVCREAIKKNLLSSAHDCSDGGLAIALAESCIKGKRGARIKIEDKMRSDALLFGESQSRIIVSINPKDLSLLQEIADKYQVSLLVLGSVEGENLNINRLISLKVDKLEKVWRGIEQ